MAGFAVNVNFLLSRVNASMPYKPGYEEDGFLKSLSPLKLTEIELLASNCTEVGGLSTVDGDKLQIYLILMQIKFHRRRPLSIFFHHLYNFQFFNFISQILVWHTQSKKNPNAMALDMGKYNRTNLVQLKQVLV